MADFITPKILKGFRDFLPGAEIKRRELVERIEKSFRSYGFVPIDTPALEYSEILLGKGGGETEKQVYRFLDQGGRDVALRFDLTVPFARFLAEHRAELTLPFKRYHIAKVWRGENTQRGRYREFTQCDIDIVGSESAAADFEILLVMRNTLQAAGAGETTIRLNHRGLFNRFLAHINAGEKSTEILRIVDKRAKIGGEETGKLLAEILGDERARMVLQYIEAKGSYEDTLSAMIRSAGGDSPESDRLWMLRRFMNDTGTAASFTLDPSITRGLDYYTGVVYETFLNDLPEIGSVCSGGRYDNLAGLYSREEIAGVGTSIGLDRLIAALEAGGTLTEKPAGASLVIACVREEDAGAYQTLAGRFREAGIPCEVFFEAQKLTQQFIAAEKKGARWVIIPAGEAPLDQPLTLREISQRKDRERLSWEEASRIIKETP
ncbi:MAG: histidine--tRNA ligase [Spirochaetaceae bacterium]|jgi:histidyl-tRNA synthetase|nr:histidine--tRNA ligase [Spirochaetaceae bacterium]